MDLNGLRDFRQTLVVRGVAQGTVSVAKTVNVAFYGTTIKCRAARGVTTATGDIVLCLRSGFEIVVIERLHASAPTADPSVESSNYPPNPWASVQTGRSTFHPVETRSLKATVGWRTDTDATMSGVIGGHSHKGCAFYGKGPGSLLGAEVTNAYVRLKRPIGRTWSPADPVSLIRFSEKTRPTGDTDVSVIGSTTGPDQLRENQQTTFQIPDAWGQELVDGVAGGLGISGTFGDPVVRLAGREESSIAWLLTLDWRRVI